MNLADELSHHGTIKASSTYQVEACCYKVSSGCLTCSGSVSRGLGLSKKTAEPVSVPADALRPFFLLAAGEHDGASNMNPDIPDGHPVRTSRVETAYVNPSGNAADIEIVSGEPRALRL